MQILIPILSRTPFFPEKDYFFPKPLIEILNKPMIELVINRIKQNFPVSKFIFVVDTSDCLKFSLDKMLMLLTGIETKIIKREGQTAGALCSCLLAIDEINQEEPLLIANSDIFLFGRIKESFHKLIIDDPEAAVFTFEAVHPRWSYVVSKNDTDVSQTFEKDVMSKKAIAGTYYFKKAKLFFNYSKSVIFNDVQKDGKFFISSTLNECILSGGKVKYQNLPKDNVHSFYSPSSINNFESKFPNLKKKQINESIIEVILPSAGLGSRFANVGWKKPKPLIDVNGKPMIAQVLDNLNHENAVYKILMQNDHIKEYKSHLRSIENNHTTICPVFGLTEGTVCTILSIQRDINLERPLVIANTDQIVDFDFSKFIKDAINRNLDGSILVFRDNEQDPKWSFARIDENEYVVEVAEKKPISKLATVGIYFFKTGREFINAAVDMIVANDRVNNEFYTCPVYNYLIKKKGKVGIFEIEKDGMHGLGTPKDLNNFLVKKNYPQSIDSP